MSGGFVEYRMRFDRILADKLTSPEGITLTGPVNIRLEELGGPGDQAILIVTDVKDPLDTVEGDSRIG